MNYASQEEDHQEKGNHQEESCQKAEEGLSLCTLWNRGHYHQGGDGSDQIVVLWFGDEAESG